MTRFIESRSFWFRLICILCLAFGLLVQVLDRMHGETPGTRSLAAVPAHAPGAAPQTNVQE
ncbi:MAG: hypothetical protein LPJ86_02595 [Caulobacteraceae bacterium]|jgi:hypothetical protein|nr:hypothetical protein [Caulobacteraceae bacterium]MDX5392691.1 hypothetical protein [Caulobacteraceae bacterium]